MKTQADETGRIAADCSLTEREQTRNLLLVAVNTGLMFLASPVLFIGVVHAALAEQLGVSATAANLPAAAYLVLSVLPLFVSWYFPQVGLLRRVLVLCYTALAAMSAAVMAVLLGSAPPGVILAVLILQGAVVGGARTVAVAFEFEVLGRAVAASRRGSALGLAYGVGPVLAIVGSLGGQLLLTGHIGELHVGRLDFPANFAALFAASIPVLGLGAWLSSRYVIPMPAVEPQRQPFRAGVFGGFREYLGQAVVRRASLIAIVVLAGYQVISNLTLYTRDVLGEAAAEYAGYQNAVRFGCKATVGVFLGWLLTRSNPKTTVLTAAAIGLSGVLWAVAASGPWFLLSFGLLGAGELFGIHITNYILCCAPAALVRRYMAFSMLTLFAAAPAGTLYGRITDCFPGAARASGFQLSFCTAAVLIGSGIGLALFLPARPRPFPRSEP